MKTKTLQNTVETNDPKFHSECDSMGLTPAQTWDVIENGTVIASIISGRASTRPIVVRETADDWEELVSLAAALKDPFDLDNVGTTTE